MSDAYLAVKGGDNSRVIRIASAVKDEADARVLSIATEDTKWRRV